MALMRLTGTDTSEPTKLLTHGTDGITVSNPTAQTQIITTSGVPNPQLYLDVFIAGDTYDQRAFAEMFVAAECNRASSPAEADLVIFTGGADVNPALYGEDPHSSTIYNIGRDEADLELYDECYKNGIPMFGVCRGAQFLHVMNGGKLIQDIDNHNGDHVLWDIKARKQIKKVSSVHHQACIRNPTGGMDTIAVASKSKTRWFNPTTKTEGPATDVEAFFYRETCCFGVQGHPEYRNYPEFRRWCLDYLNQFINENVDLVLTKPAKGGTSVRRMKPDIMAQRDKEWANKLAGTNTVVIN